MISLGTEGKTGNTISRRRIDLIQTTENQSVSWKIPRKSPHKRTISPKRRLNAIKKPCTLAHQSDYYYRISKENIENLYQLLKYQPLWHADLRHEHNLHPYDLETPRLCRLRRQLSKNTRSKSRRSNFLTSLQRLHTTKGSEHKAESNRVRRPKTAGTAFTVVVSRIEAQVVSIL